MQILSSTLKVVVRGMFLVVGLFVHYMERLADWFVGYHKKTEYIRKGSCIKCGKCCRLVGISYPRFLNRFPRIVRLLIRWHSFRYGFIYEGLDDNMLVYRCRFLKEDGRCKIYHFRPRLCREYPKVGVYGRPRVPMGCGFYFVRRDGAPSFSEALYIAGKNTRERLGSEIKG